MLGNKYFWYGIVAGLAGTWAWHAFAKPLPRPNSGNGAS